MRLCQNQYCSLPLDREARTDLCTLCEKYDPHSQDYRDTFRRLSERITDEEPSRADLIKIWVATKDLQSSINGLLNSKIEDVMREDNGTFGIENLQ